MYPVLFEIPNVKAIASEFLILEIILAIAATLAWVALKVRGAEGGWIAAVSSTVAILLVLHIGLSFFIKDPAGEPAPITIYSFGVIIILGFLAGAWFMIKQTDLLGLESQKIFDWAFWCLVVGIVGARLLFAWLNAEDFSKDKMELFKIWNGGLVWYGGLVPAAIVGIWLLGRYKLPTLHVADIGSSALMLALGIGRWACLLAGDDYGKPTDSWVGIRFYNERALIPEALRGTAEHAATALHPTQLYMSLNCLWLFFVLELIRRKSKHAGTAFAAMIILYAVTRAAFIEPFRGDFAERNPSWGKHVVAELVIEKDEGSPALSFERGAAVTGTKFNGQLLDAVSLPAGEATATVWAISDDPVHGVEAQGGFRKLTKRDIPPEWNVQKIESTPARAREAQWYTSDLGTPPGYVSTSQTISIVMVLIGAAMLFLFRKMKEPGFADAIENAPAPAA